jgi:hypothetical protein
MLIHIGADCAIAMSSVFASPLVQKLTALPLLEVETFNG